MMGDRKALQFCTSHFLGQNFAQAFEVKYLDQSGVLQHCWTTSWGLSTRVIGGIIMVHGDDQGLVLPPKLAPTQVVIVPIFKNDEEKATVLKTAKELKQRLIQANFRVTLDEREGFSPGWKFNDWEMRGVPVRVELGPKDVAKQAAMLARRDRPGKEGKSFVPQLRIAAPVKQTRSSAASAAPAARQSSVSASIGRAGSCTISASAADARVECKLRFTRVTFVESGCEIGIASQGALAHVGCGSSKAVAARA
jgi:prolyl-tRNA synthetase